MSSDLIDVLQSAFIAVLGVHVATSRESISRRRRRLFYRSQQTDVWSCRWCRWMEFRGITVNFVRGKRRNVPVSLYGTFCFLFVWCYQQIDPSAYSRTLMRAAEKAVNDDHTRDPLQLLCTAEENVYPLHQLHYCMKTNEHTQNTHKHTNTHLKPPPSPPLCYAHTHIHHPSQIHTRTRVCKCDHEYIY